MKARMLVAIVFLVGLFVGRGFTPVDAQPSALPSVFAAGEFFEKGEEHAILYQVKATHGEWIQVVIWEKGKPTTETRWINAATGQTWVHSPK